MPNEAASKDAGSSIWINGFFHSENSALLSLRQVIIRIVIFLGRLPLKYIKI